MVDWVINTTKVASDADGLGTEYGDNDSLTVNTPGHFTFDLDWSGSDGSRETRTVYTSEHGTIIQENGVKLYFKDLENYGGNGTVYIMGQSGGGTEAGENNGAKRIGAVWVNKGGKFSATYTTFGFIENECQIAYAGEMYFKNCAFKTHSERFIYQVNGGGKFFFDTCTFTTTFIGHAYIIFTNTVYMNIVLKDCTFDNTWDSFDRSGYGCNITFVGSISFRGNTEPDATWFNESNTHKVSYSFYEEVAYNDTASTEDAIIGVRHPSATADGLLEWSHDEHYDVYPAVFAMSDTDASGDGKIYLLKRVAKTNNLGTFINKYFSDSGQAETGDNQKYIVGLGKEGYHFKTKTVWADAGTANFTLKTEMTESLSGTLVEKDSITGVIDD